MATSLIHNSKMLTVPYFKGSCFVLLEAIQLTDVKVLIEHSQISSGKCVKTVSPPLLPDAQWA